MHKNSVYFHKMVTALQAVSALFVFGSHGVGGWKLGFDRLGHVCEQSVGVVRFEQRHRVVHRRKEPKS